MGASDVRVHGVVLSRFALDGGAMHGIVPRPLWERIHVPDEKNRIALVARAIVVDHERAGTRALLELGLGQRWSDKERRLYAIDRGPDARGALADAGIDPDSITHVILTHLHWDHAGGLCRGADLSHPAELSFPRAEHVMSSEALRAARNPSDKDRGSFRFDDVDLLLRVGKVREACGGEELAPGIVCEISRGHTEGLLVPRVHARDDGPPLAFPTDLVPTRSHLKPSWVAAYDCLPVESVAEKQRLFESLADEQGALVLYHDPDVEMALPTRGPNGIEHRLANLDGTSSAPTS